MHVFIALAALRYLPHRGSVLSGHRDLSPRMPVGYGTRKRRRLTWKRWAPRAFVCARPRWSVTPPQATPNIPRCGNPERPGPNGCPGARLLAPHPCPPFVSRPFPSLFAPRCRGCLVRALPSCMWIIGCRWGGGATGSEQLSAPKSDATKFSVIFSGDRETGGFAIRRERHRVPLKPHPRFATVGRSGEGGGGRYFSA